MRVVDAHMHLNLNGFEADDLIQYLDFHKIEKCWLLTWEEAEPAIPYIYQHLDFENIIETYEKYPSRIVPFYAPDPGDKAFEEKLKIAISRGAKGCGELKVSLKWEDPVIENYLTVIEQMSVPLIFHMENPRNQYVPDGKGFIDRLFERLLNDKYNGVSRYYLNRFIDSTGIFRRKVKSNQIYFPGYLFDFEYLEKRIVQFPGIKFIGHGPEFWNAISVNMHPKFIHQPGRIGQFGIIDTLLESYDNFFCDISGNSGFNALNRDKKAARIFLEKHSKKILFGTDNTRFNLMDYLLSLKLSTARLDQILYLNSENLINQ